MENRTGGGTNVLGTRDTRDYGAIAIEYYVLPLVDVVVVVVLFGLPLGEKTRARDHN